MSPQPFLELLLSPFAIMLLFACVILSTGLTSTLPPRGRPRIRFVQILGGYGTVILVMFAFGWLLDRLSFGVGEGLASIFLAYFAVLIMSLIGVPTIAVLVAVRRGTVAWCLLASVGIGVTLVPFYFSIGSVSSRSFLEWVEYATLFSVLLLSVMVSFCVGARIPWRQE